MKKSILINIFFALITLFSQAKNINGEIIEGENITILKVWGTHQERGYAYGFLTGNKISQALDTYRKVVPDKKMNKLKILYETDKLLLKFDTNIVIEAKAMITGMNESNTNLYNIDFLDLLIINSLFDIKSIKHLPKVKGFACSALMSWGEATENTDLQGMSVISRHFDWFNSEGILKNQIMIVHIPSEKNEQPWLNIGLAGQIGIQSGINKSGVTGFVNALPFSGGKGKNNVLYEPITFTLRKGLERNDYNKDKKNNVLDIKSALLSNENGYAEGTIIYSLGSALSKNNDEITMIAELTPDAPHFTFRNSEFEDNIPGDNLYVANSLLKKKNRKKHGRRNNDIIKAFESLYPKGKNISSENNWKLLRDYSQFRVIANIETNIQFMQFIPEKQQLKLSVSYDKTHAYKLEPMIYDLKKMFTVDY